MKGLKSIFISLVLMVMSQWVYAAGYMPFILADTTGESVADASAKVEQSVKNNGFEVVGSYQPMTGVKIIVVTNDVLKNIAAQSQNGGFGAMERIAIVNRKGTVQVSYTNPAYWWNVYRMKGDITPVQTALETALGKQKAFGADQPLSAEALREYHYKFMMPYFDDVDDLAYYESHEEGVRTIENHLAAQKAGVSKVYRIDLPESNMTVFGVQMTKGEGADENVLKSIDVAEYSHAAHLPYEILVVGDKAIALNGKFRIAISWTSLSMMGSNSFMSIANAPDEIKEALEAVAEK
ncbi:hypothetical protein [Galenea microaerophila]